MSEETLADDQSHYEVSLTAGQAFLAFVLLLLSLAASFAFGLVIGRSSGDERIAAKKDPVVTEASVIPRKPAATEVATRDDDFKQVEPPKITEEATATVPSVTASANPPAPSAAANPESRIPNPESRTATSEPRVPHIAQILSTSDQKTAETLAAKLIDSGFTTAYVDRGPVTEKGTIWRVRVKFPSEEEAKAAEAKLRTFSKDVWITKQP